MLPKSRAKYIQSLHHKKFRDQYGEFIAEGPKVVGELIKRNHGWIQAIYGTTEWQAAQPQDVRNIISASFTVIEHFELEKISTLQKPQQVLALVKQPQHQYTSDNNWLLILDGIQDPGNLGTIVRTAHWFGIHQIVCSPDCADAYSPKVVQASMGSIFQVNVVYNDLPTFLNTYQQPVYGASLEGENIFSIKAALPGAIVIGSEGKGIRPDVASFITPITIPGAGNAESLNAAVAAGILMSQFCESLS